MKTEDIYAGIAKDNKTRFSTSTCELEKPLLRRINKKVIGLVKDKLGEKLTKFTARRQKAFNYLAHDGGNNKKTKGTKKRVIKQELRSKSN